MTEEVEVQFPQSIGEAVDLLYEKRAARLLIERDAADLKKIEGALKAHIIQKLGEQTLEGAKGKLATATITYSDEAIVKDWVMLRAYIIAEDAWEMVQKRVSITALRERWKNGVAIPGVEKYQDTDLSLVKAGSSKS
jgi:hypothetical protein